MCIERKRNKPENSIDKPNVMVFGVATDQNYVPFLTNFIILNKYVNSLGITCQRGICYRYSTMKLLLFYFYFFYELKYN